MLRREDFKIIGDVASNYEFFLYNDFFAVNVSSKSQGINKQFDIMQRCIFIHKSIALFFGYFFLSRNSQKSKKKKRIFPL